MTLQEIIMLALKASILLTVFGFGLQATVHDVSYVLRRPFQLAKSLLAMFVIMPIIAIALARVFEFRHSVEIVLVALAVSPLPPILPGKEQKAGGDVSYGLGLMVVVGLLSIVTVPAALRFVGHYFFANPFQMSAVVIAKIILTAAVLPLVAGLAVRALFPEVAARILRPVKFIATAGLALAALALLVGTAPSAYSLVGNGSILAFAAFVVAGLAVGHWLGGPDPRDRPVLALSTASRHPAIAFAIAKANFPDEPYLGAAIVLYLLVNTIIGIPYLRWQRSLRPTLANT